MNSIIYTGKGTMKNLTNLVNNKNHCTTELNKEDYAVFLSY